MQLHPALIQVCHVDILAPAILAQVHDAAHILRGRDDGGPDKGLLRQLDLRGIGVVEGVVDHGDGAVGAGDPVDHAGGGGDEVQVEFPLQPQLDDLHMQQAQEAAPEAEAQSHGALRLIAQRGVVELELLQGVPQLRIFGPVGGIHAGIDHGLYVLVALERLCRRVFHAGDGVAHPGVGDVFDGGGEVAHFAGAQSFRRLHAPGMEIAHLHHLVDRTAGHHSDVHALADHAVHDPEVDDDALVAVILAVEDQRPQGKGTVALRGGQIPDDHLQHGGDVDSVFGGDLRRVLGGQADDVLHLPLDPLGVRRRQVDLVDDRKDLQARVDGQIGVGQGLGFHALGGVHHQYRTLAGRQGTAYLIVEVHMPRGVDQVEHIGLPVRRGVQQPDGPGLDGDAPLPLQVHVVQDLVLHVPGLHRLAGLQQAVRQGGFSVVDVGNDGEISDFI